MKYPRWKYKQCKIKHLLWYNKKIWLLVLIFLVVTINIVTVVCLLSWWYEVLLSSLFLYILLFLTDLLTCSNKIELNIERITFSGRDID